jgi:MarR family transcriptional regulator, organic hydroperoxide resistance regulator
MLWVQSIPIKSLSRYTQDMSEDLKLKNQLCHRLYKASNAIVRAYRPLLTPLGLTYPQYVVLMSLWEHDDVAIQDLIEHTQIDGGSLTQILTKLQQKAWLILQRDAEDGRKRRVQLTAAGHALKQEAQQVPERMACQVQGLSLEESYQLAHLLDRLTEDLEG